MEYELRCRFCKKETKTLLSNFDTNEELEYEIQCRHCKKNNIISFPSELNIQKFHKALGDKEVMVFQNYVFKKLSFRQTSKKTGIPLTTCWFIIHKIGVGARNLRQARKNYWKQKRRNKKGRHVKEN